MAKKIENNQIGVVSIMVTMIMMIVISLIVLGFAEVSRVEQRSSTDDQLSTQAFYSAESGINDARQALDNEIKLDPNTPLTNKASCLGSGDGGSTPSQSYYNFNYNINSQYNDSIACLLVTTNVPTLQYTIGYKPTVIPIISTGAIGTLNLDWGLSSGSSAGTCPAVSQFPPDTGSNSWKCNFPLLEVDLADTSNTTTALTRQNWPENALTIFFVPVTGTTLNTVTWGSTATGTVFDAPCSTITDECTVKITNLNDDNYYLMATTIYNAGSTLTLSSSSNFYNVQAIIDSTGKAQDTLRRVVVAIDLTDANSHPISTGAIISENSICKQFSVTSTTFSNPTTYVGGSIAGKNGEPNILCNTTPKDP